MTTRLYIPRPHTTHSPELVLLMLDDAANRFYETGGGDVADRIFDRAEQLRTQTTTTSKDRDQ